MISIKSRRELAKMEKAGATVAEVHQAVREAAVPGASLLDLEAISARIIEANGCTSSFLNYHGSYPATLCLSPNDVIVHGIPTDYRLEEGDILSVDAGAIYEGFHGDAAFTIGIGEISDEAKHLIDITEQALWAGVRQVKAGNRLGDIGAAVARIGSEHGYGVVEEYVGHGIGRQMHEEPQVPNYRTKTRGIELAPGICLAIEPMFTLGSADVETLADGWTVVTRDGSLAAHWEDTVAVTEDGPLVLTRP